MASNSDNRAAFTAGPWHLSNGTVLGADGVGVTRPIERFDGASEANARLISAAPDLYEALRFFVSEHNSIADTMADPLYDPKDRPEGGWTCGCPACERAIAVLSQIGGAL